MKKVQAVESTSPQPRCTECGKPAIFHYHGQGWLCGVCVEDRDPRGDDPEKPAGWPDADE